jgi:hypothetical protein
MYETNACIGLDCRRRLLVLLLVLVLTLFWKGRTGSSHDVQVGERAYGHKGSQHGLGTNTCNLVLIRRHRHRHRASRRIHPF